MPFLPSNQLHQSSEGIEWYWVICTINIHKHCICLFEWYSNRQMRMLMNVYFTNDVKESEWTLICWSYTMPLLLLHLVSGVCYLYWLCSGDIVCDGQSVIWLLLKWWPTCSYCYRCCHMAEIVLLPVVSDVCYLYWLCSGDIVCDGQSGVYQWYCCVWSDGLPTHVATDAATMWARTFARYLHDLRIIIHRMRTVVIVAAWSECLLVTSVSYAEAVSYTHLTLPTTPYV